MAVATRDVTKAPLAPAPTAGSGRLSAALRRHERVLLLIPALVLVGLFYLLPIFLNFLYAFTDWSTFKNTVDWVGMRNFAQLFQAGDLSNALWTTIKYALAVMVVENLVALALALALAESNRVNGFFRAVFFLPVLVAPLAAGYLFQGILRDEGTLNGFLSSLTGLDIHISWLGSATWTIFVIALIQVWKFFGVHMLVYIAALNAVPTDLLEASRVEGAGFWTTLRRVRLPLIAPAFTFNVTLTLIGALSTFDLVLATTRGGPGSSSEVMNMLVFEKYGTGAFGFATAISFVLFIIIVLAAIPLIAFLRRREVEL